MAKVNFKSKTHKRVTFSDMKIGQIAEIVSEDYAEYFKVVVLKCAAGEGGLIASLCGRYVWTHLTRSALEVRILTKDEVVEISNS